MPKTQLKDKWPSRVRIKPDIVSRNLDGEEVILNLTTKTYFGLDAVGTRVWHLIQNGRSVEEIRRDILAEYEVGPEEFARHLKKLLGNLQENGLIEHD